MIILDELEVVKRNQIKTINKFNKKIKSNIKKIYLYQFLMGFYLISGVLIPFFLTWGHINIIEFDLLQGYYFIMIFLLEIPCGMIGDHISRKKLLFLAGIFSTFAALIYGLVPNIFIFYIGETLFAMGDALFSGSVESLIYGSLKTQHKEKNFSKVLGKSKSFFLLGIVISSPLGSLIGYNFSLQFVMIFMCIPYIGCSIIALTLKEPPHKEKKKSHNPFHTIKSTFKLLKENKTIKILVLDMIVIEIFILVLSLNYQYYLYNELHIPMVYLGFINAILILSELLFTYSISTQKNRIKNKKLLLLFVSILPGIFYVLIGTIHVVPVNLILILLIIGLGLSRYILFYDGINKRIKEGTRVTTFSVIDMIRMVPGALILPLFGLIITTNVNIAFVMIGLFIIILTLSSRVKKEHI